MAISIHIINAVSFPSATVGDEAELRQGRGGERGEEMRSGRGEIKEEREEKENQTRGWGKYERRKEKRDSNL